MACDVLMYCLDITHLLTLSVVFEQVNMMTHNDDNDNDGDDDDVKSIMSSYVIGIRSKSCVVNWKLNE